MSFSHSKDMILDNLQVWSPWKKRKFKHISLLLESLKQAMKISRVYQARIKKFIHKVQLSSQLLSKYPEFEYEAKYQMQIYGLLSERQSSMLPVALGSSDQRCIQLKTRKKD
ncbi:hypothetical protein CUMW_168670 [Citrus unshiu]|uniref:Uncharacterized protein n=1 Tax=Citrus unshiu TaxID=55188 RepID=A0A2H5PUI1_CITUN|nr:hypothetical protein CUMW_168670 [Citrus unshiu]